MTRPFRTAPMKDGIRYDDKGQPVGDTQTPVADRYANHPKHDDWWCECGHPYAEQEPVAPAPTPVEPPVDAQDGDRLPLRDELTDFEHEVAAFMHTRLWGPTVPVHDTEPGDGSDCHECYAEAERLFSVILAAARLAATKAGPS